MTRGANRKTRGPGRRLLEIGKDLLIAALVLVNLTLAIMCLPSTTLTQTKWLASALRPFAGLFGLNEAELTYTAPATGSAFIGAAQPVADETPTGPIPVVPSAAPGDHDQSEPAEEATVPDESTPHLPATVAETAPAVPAREVERKPNPFVPPVLDEAARTIAGFVRPLVPPIVARVLPGGGTRTVQQSYEEVEEVTFSMRRTRRYGASRWRAKPKMACAVSGLAVTPAARVR